MAFVACAIAACLVRASAEVQPAVPLSCNAIIQANEDFHVPHEMVLEDGARAFAYGSDDAPFVRLAGQAITFTLTLAFDPTEDAAIKLLAIDDSCSGGTSSNAVFGFTFRELTSRVNTMSYDADAATITFNGVSQRALAMGTPRFMWIEVSDGKPSAPTASYSYTVDRLHPDSAVSR